MECFMLYTISSLEHAQHFLLLFLIALFFINLITINGFIVKYLLKSISVHSNTDMYVFIADSRTNVVTDSHKMYTWQLFIYVEVWAHHHLLLQRKTLTSKDNKSSLTRDLWFEEGVCVQLPEQRSDWPRQWWRSWRPSYPRCSLLCISGTSREHSVQVVGRRRRERKCLMHGEREQYLCLKFVPKIERHW